MGASGTPRASEPTETWPRWFAVLQGGQTRALRSPNHRTVIWTVPGVHGETEVEQGDFVQGLPGLLTKSAQNAGLPAHRTLCPFNMTFLSSQRGLCSRTQRPRTHNDKPSKFLYCQTHRAETPSKAETRSYRLLFSLQVLLSMNLGADDLCAQGCLHGSAPVRLRC